MIIVDFNKLKILKSGLKPCKIRFEARTMQIYIFYNNYNRYRGKVAKITRRTDGFMVCRSTYWCCEPSCNWRAHSSLVCPNQMGLPTINHPQYYHRWMVKKTNRRFMIGFVLWEVLVTIIVLNDFQWQSILTPWGCSSHETVP